MKPSGSELEKKKEEIMIAKLRAEESCRLLPVGYCFFRPQTPLVVRDMNLCIRASASLMVLLDDYEKMLK